MNISANSLFSYVIDGEKKSGPVGGKGKNPVEKKPACANRRGTCGERLRDERGQSRRIALRRSGRQRGGGAKDRVNHVDKDKSGKRYQRGHIKSTSGVWGRVSRQMVVCHAQHSWAGSRVVQRGVTKQRIAVSRATQSMRGTREALGVQTEGGEH